MSLLIVPAFTSPRFGTRSSAIRVTRHTRSDGDGIPRNPSPPENERIPPYPTGGSPDEGRAAVGRGFPPMTMSAEAGDRPAGLPPMEREGLSLPTHPPGSPGLKGFCSACGIPAGTG